MSLPLVTSSNRQFSVPPLLVPLEEAGCAGPQPAPSLKSAPAKLQSEKLNGEQLSKRMAEILGAFALRTTSFCFTGPAERCSSQNRDIFYICDVIHACSEPKVVLVWNQFLDLFIAVYKNPDDLVYRAALCDFVREHKECEDAYEAVPYLHPPTQTS